MQWFISLTSVCIKWKVITYKLKNKIHEKYVKYIWWDDFIERNVASDLFFQRTLIIFSYKSRFTAKEFDSRGTNLTFLSRPSLLFSRLLLYWQYVRIHTWIRRNVYSRLRMLIMNVIWRINIICTKDFSFNKDWNALILKTHRIFYYYLEMYIFYLKKKK